MALNWTTTDKAATDHGIKVMVYGRAGMGKTQLCGTAPKPFIISAEAGLLTLRNKAIPVITVGSFVEAWEAYTWAAQNAVKQGFLTVCVDSISEIAEKSLSAAKLKKNDPRAAYGDMAEETIKLVKAFRDLPGLNVVITCKETTKVDGLTNVMKAEPQTPGQQVGPALPYLFDEVFHAHKLLDNLNKEHHVLRTKAAFNADAKDRSGVLDEIEYPDLANIFHKIKTTPKAA